MNKQATHIVVPVVAVVSVVAVAVVVVVFVVFTLTNHYFYPTTSCSTPSVLLCCVNFQSFFPFWTACDTPSIEVDTTEQQVARHNQPNMYICARQVENKILRSNIHDIGRNHE